MTNFIITSSIFNEITDMLSNEQDSFFETNYHTLLALAENELSLTEEEREELSEDELQDKIDDEISNIISVNRISRDGLLYHALLKWFKYKGHEVKESREHPLVKNVRSAVMDEDYLYYVTGCGYDTISSDLLGGNADGLSKREFLEWINK